MGIRHRVRINIADSKKEHVLEAAHTTLPRRLLKILFGDFTNIYLLSPGQSIESVEIHEISQKEKSERIGNVKDNQEED